MCTERDLLKQFKVCFESLYILIIISAALARLQNLHLKAVVSILKIVLYN